jgi:hypothetical protein
VKQARQRHYVNPKDPGITLFITTTVLDFVHAFHRHEVRDGMLFAIGAGVPLGQGNALWLRGDAAPCAHGAQTPPEEARSAHRITR